MFSGCISLNVIYFPETWNAINGDSPFPSPGDTEPESAIYIGGTNLGGESKWSG